MKMSFVQSFLILLCYFTVLIWLHMTLPPECEQLHYPPAEPQNFAVPDTMACDDFLLLSVHPINAR